MYGEGYDYPPLYTPSSGDITGALPVGIQTRAESDIPYWPVQNTWTYKEIWIHPVSQWIGIMREIEGTSLRNNSPDQPGNDIKVKLSGKTSPNGLVNITATVEGNGKHNFSLRCSNLKIKDTSRAVNLEPGKKAILKWTGRTNQVDEEWVALAIADNNIENRWELTGSAWK
jgi:hypothetical protein